MALPVTVDLTAYRGDTWAQTLKLIEAGTAYDLTGATVASKARSLTGSPGVLVMPLVVTVIEPPTGGLVTLSLPASPPPAGVYRYDLEVTKADKVTTWVKGELVVERDVTNELAA